MHRSIVIRDNSSLIMQLSLSVIRCFLWNLGPRYLSATMVLRRNRFAKVNLPSVSLDGLTVHNSLLLLLFEDSGLHAVSTRGRKAAIPRNTFWGHIYYFMNVQVLLWTMEGSTVVCRQLH